MDESTEADSAITVEIPSALRSCCDGARELQLSADNARSVLIELKRQYPELHRSVCHETGAVRPHVNLFLNSRLLRGEEDFATPLHRGDVISIFQAVSGG